MSFVPKLERYYVFKRKRSIDTIECDEAVLGLADRAIFEAKIIDNNNSHNPYGGCDMKLSYYPSIDDAEMEFRQKVKSLTTGGFSMAITDSINAEKVMDRITEAARRDMPECDYLVALLAS